MSDIRPTVECTHGHEVSRDLWWLWNIEGELSLMNGKDEYVDALRQKLRRYLHDSCVSAGHHWHEYPESEAYGQTVGAHKQCLWCNAVEWKEAAWVS